MAEYRTVRRLRAIGNSMAVPVMRWIGERIDRVILGRKWYAFPK